MTGSNDRSIRLWHRTEDQVFIEEEQENALEELFDEGLDASDQVIYRPLFVHPHLAIDGLAGVVQVNGEGVKIPGVAANGVESGLAAKKSVESLKSGEKLFEAIELAEQESKEEEAYQEAKLKAEAYTKVGAA